MNLQRLKFAWARGARIEIRIRHVAEPAWLLANPNGFNWSGDYDFRIHPDDEHLAYGPVSTAFRDMALFMDYADTLGETVDLFLDMAGANWLFEGIPSNNIESDFCRLMFAEYLADEGL